MTFPNAGPVQSSTDGSQSSADPTTNANVLRDHSEFAAVPPTGFVQSPETTARMDPLSSAPVQPVPQPPNAFTAPLFVYALGRIESRLPTIALEKEFAQVAGQADTAGLTDHQVLHHVLSDRSNRYLARQLCWIFTVEGLETYILIPRDPTDFDLLIEAVRPRPSLADLDVIIGVQGPLTPPEMCGGLVLPTVIIDQTYSFDRESLLSAIPQPESITDSDQQFRATAEELLDRIMQLADNAGATDEHRAVNYLAVRYPAIYARLAEAHSQAMSLASVDVRHSRLSGARKIVDVIFSFVSRQSGVSEQSFVRVDVTEEFPFLVSKLAPYYQR
jgi:hypothetical protein